jgi:hypothetical protein
MNVRRCKVPSPIRNIYAKKLKQQYNDEENLSDQISEDESNEIDTKESVLLLFCYYVII